MQPVYIDLHIHTYPDANNRTTDYDIVTLVPNWLRSAENTELSTLTFQICQTQVSAM